MLCTAFSLQAQLPEHYKDSLQVSANAIHSDSLKAQHYYQASTQTLQQFGDFKWVRHYIDSAFYYSQKAHFKDSEAKCHFMYGLLNRIEGHFDTALVHLQMNIDYFKDDPKNKSYALYQVGAIYSAQGDYESSLSTYLEILALFEASQDSFAIASTLNSIANIYGKMGQNDEAITNYHSAKSIFTDLNQKRDIALADNNIGEIYIRKGDTTSAKTHIIKALNIAQEIENTHLIASAHYHLGRATIGTNPEQALTYYFEAVKLFKEGNDETNLLLVYADIAKYYQNNNNKIEAKFYFHQGLALAEQYDILPSQANINKDLADLYQQEGNYKKALDHQSAYIRINDSLFNIENTQQINRLQKQFESEQKDKALLTKTLALQQQENALQKEEIQNNLMVGLLIILLVTMAIGWYLFRQYKQRQQAKVIALKREYQIKTLESLIEGEETERLRIAKELHDGVNGDLSAIKFKLSSLLEQNNLVIKEAISMLDNSYNHVRAISHNLVPPSLEHFKLEEVIQTYCQNMNQIHQPEISFHKIGDPLDFEKNVGINIFRIIQELVANSLKHAQAQHITVQISNTNGLTLITCEDDGVGFDQNAHTSGIGLKNIESRINYLNANIDLISNEKGTSYTIEIDNNNTHDH